jgi:hypothetical protein
VRFVVDKVALGKDFFRVRSVFPASIIPSFFHTHLDPLVTFARRKDRRIPKGDALSEIEGRIG